MYRAIQVETAAPVCTIRLHRPEADNAINAAMIDEIAAVLDSMDPAVHILVLEGSPEVFCFGADFRAIGSDEQGDAGPLYDTWLRLATGPWITLAHVRGRVNAGGVGFVAACDVALADRTAVLSLSELLFGLLPACVLPFLIRRVGFQRAHYMTLSTQPISADQATSWGLIDACDDDSRRLLHRHLLRLRRLSPAGFRRYRTYMNGLHDLPQRAKGAALTANREVFSDRETQDKIRRYVETGQFPWEA